MQKKKKSYFCISWDVLDHVVKEKPSALLLLLEKVLGDNGMDVAQRAV